MKGALTLSMAWLHTWSGLIFGWILFPVFLTGAIAVFWAEITCWATPSMPRDVRVDRDRLTRVATDYLETHVPDAPMWRINYPRAREPLLRVIWSERGAIQSRHLDPATGAVLDDVADSGKFFIRFHYAFNLDRAKNPIGFFIIGAAAIVMLVGCVSGIVIHKRLFKDFFTFRPHSSPQRAWLDGHNLISVLPLPFHIMITYTGLVLLCWQYMPAAVHALYPDEATYRTDVLQRAHATGAAVETHVGMQPLYSLVRKAEQHMGDGNVAYLYIFNPNRSNAVVEISRRRDDRIAQQSDRIVFDGVSGQRLQQLDHVDRSYALRTQSFASALHFMEFGGPLIRWLYVFGGLAGAAAIATGLVLFERKRAQRDDHQLAPFVLRLIAALNITAIAGTTMACAAFLWGERLLLATGAERTFWSASVFFGTWAISLLHALARPTSRGWVEQLSAAALLCFGVPMLAFATAPALSLPHSLAQGDWVRAGVDLSAAAAGLLIAASARHLHRRESLARRGR